MVPVRDSLSLAEAMVNIYNLDQEELDEMGKASRQKVLDEFDEKIINKQYLDLVQDIFDDEKIVVPSRKNKKVT